MYKTLKPIVFILAVVAYSLFVNPTHAQEKLTPAQQFTQWKATIPDYEKRLYDRVKSLNKRTVRIQSTTIIGFVVLFLFMVVLFFRQGSRGAIDAYRPIRMSKKILENQKTLIILLSELKATQHLLQSESEGFSKLIKSSEIQVVKLQEKIEMESTDKPDN